MKRRGLAVLLAAVLGASMLAGCGNSEDGSSGGKKKVRLMVWSPSEDQSKDSGEWLQTTCEKFADEHPEWDITFVYGVADEATAAGQVAQDPEASADVFYVCKRYTYHDDGCKRIGEIRGKIQRGDRKNKYRRSHLIPDKERGALRCAVYDKHLVYVL